MKPILTTSLIALAVLVLARFEEGSVSAGNDPKSPKPEAGAGTLPAAADHRVFELRTYHTNEGKLDDLNKRFREHTCDLLKKHGAELIGFWTPTDEKDGKGETLVYSTLAILSVFRGVCSPSSALIARTANLGCAW